MASQIFDKGTPQANKLAFFAAEAPMTDNGNIDQAMFADLNSIQQKALFSSLRKVKSYSTRDGRKVFLEERLLVSPQYQQKILEAENDRKIDSKAIVLEPREIIEASGKATKIYSKNIFNQKTNLPQIECKQSQQFFHKVQTSNLRSVPSLPEIQKYPGVLNSSSSQKYIQRYEKKKPQVSYSIFESSYRNKNLVSNSVRLSSNLYSDLKWKLAGGKDFEFGQVDDPKITVDEQIEKDYLKSQVMMMDDAEYVDQFPKQLATPASQDHYFKHYKMIESVEQQNQLGKVQPSVYTKLLKSTSQNRLLPIKYGVLKPQHSPNPSGKVDSQLDLR